MPAPEGQAQATRLPGDLKRAMACAWPRVAAPRGPRRAGSESGGRHPSPEGVPGGASESPEGKGGEGGQNGMPPGGSERARADMATAEPTSTQRPRWVPPFNFQLRAMGPKRG